ncbi:MAG: hypothetical protein OEV44_14235 [Spirochaetota bacterium]|nr:hypothetical protein [Spirochaetota bacterium]
MSNISQSNNSNHELDPEIADLLGIDPEELSASPEKLEDKLQPVDISSQSEFMQAVLDGEKGEAIDNLLKYKELFEKALDKEEKGIYREKLGVAYWNFYRTISHKIMGTLSIEKKLCMRFNLLDVKNISESQLKMVKSIPIENSSDTIFYLDEWLKRVGEGAIDQSVIDETAVAKKREGAGAQEKLEKKLGQREAELQVIKAKIDQVQLDEARLKQLVDEVMHQNKTVFMDDKESGLIEPYSDAQKSDLSMIVEICKNLSRADRDLGSSYKILADIDDDIEKLRDDVDSDIGTDDSNKIISEFNTVKQMIKMSVGRQGNHFPILLGHYFTDEINQVATIQNVEKVIQYVEKLDPGLFIRAYKGENHRIVPYMILLPCYGELGICWDPIPKNNRATGKGRIAVPIFPKNLLNAVIAALADIRWQVAKEKAQHYWMEEGLTGSYYEYYQNEKLKGDIRKFFIQDYMLWINWESKAVQKLHKDVRNIFWRLMPFPQELKDDLKNKGFYYSELYQKDKRREKSVGY